jgi:acyl-CoA synthetase (NDP forming)
VSARLARDCGEALAAARDLGFPVALKAMGLLHKSDAGGVVLDLDDPQALLEACEGLRERLGCAAFSVERMAPRERGVELIVGCRQDARFGPVALVGLGGIYAEVLRDVAVALAPVDQAQARRLLEGLRGAALLRGARGRPPLSLAAAAEVAATLSRFAAEHPEVAEVELNPLLVTTDSAVALDARLVLAAPSREA